MHFSKCTFRHGLTNAILDERKTWSICGLCGSPTERVLETWDEISRRCPILRTYNTVTTSANLSEHEDQPCYSMTPGNRARAQRVELVAAHVEEVTTHRILSVARCAEEMARRKTRVLTLLSAILIRTHG